MRDEAGDGRLQVARKLLGHLAVWKSGGEYEAGASINKRPR